MAVEGTLDLFKLPEILQLISQQKKTGILTIQGQQDIVAVSFLNGGIVAADSLNQTLEEGLSKILVSEGLLTAPDMARAMSEHQSSGGRLLDLLVERRFLDRAQLLHAIRAQIRRLLEELLRWEQGDFKFYSNDEVFYEEGFIPLSVEELLIHAAQAQMAQPRAASRQPAPVAAPPVSRAPSAGSAAGAPAGGTAPFRPPPGPLPVSTVPSPAASAARPASRPAAGAPAAPPAPPAHGGLKVVRAESAPGVTPIAMPAASETATGAFRKMTVERPRRLPVPERLIPALLAILLFIALLSASGPLFLPFPWQDKERAAVAENQRNSLYLKIDRAAKTYFLLEGGFPDRLNRLAALGLLAPRDLEDPQGRPFDYAPSDESYVLQPVENGRPVPGEGTTEAITGNFLIDPEFLSVPAETRSQPLVLLD